MEFEEIPAALDLSPQEWGFLTGFFQFHEEPMERLSPLCVTPEERVDDLVTRLRARGLVRCRTEGGRVLFSLSPPDEWLPSSEMARDPERFAIEVEVLRRILDLRGRRAITIVGTREIRRKDLLVPEVVRYATTLFPSVDLRLGTRCNLNCVYCLLGHENRFLRPLSEIVEDLRFAREQHIEKVSFTGGEPTLHPDLLKVVAAARAMGFRRITLVTNGLTLSYPGRLDRLVEAGVNAIGISFDTPDPKTAEAMWQVGGESSRGLVFDRVVRAIEDVGRFPDLPLQSIAVVTSFNRTQLPDLARFFVDLKRRMPNLFVPTLDFVMPEENAWIHRERVVPRLSETVEFVREALEIAHNHGLPLTYRGFPFCLLPGLERYSFDRYMTIFSLVRGATGVVHDRATLDLRRVKAQGCATCRWNRECTGFSRSYANIYGLDETRPVPDEGEGGAT